jgi:AraC-like DNA-binding protein
MTRQHHSEVFADETTPTGNAPQGGHDVALLGLHDAEVALIVESVEARTHITTLMRGLVRVRHADATQLSALAQNASVCAGLLYLDGNYGRISHVTWLAHVSEFHQASTRRPLIAYAPVTPSAMRQCLLATQAGVHDVAIRGYDDLRLFVRRSLESHYARPMAAEIVDQVSGACGPLDEEAAQVVRCCVQEARARLTVDGLASALGLSRRTVAKRLHAAGLPAPESLIMWGRLLVAAWLLRNPRCSVARTALELGFPSAQALRGLAGRYLGYPPDALRVPSGVANVAMALSRAAGRPHPERSAR